MNVTFLDVAPSPSRSHSQDQSQDVGNLFDNDVDVDVTEAADDMDERAPQSISPAGSSYEPTGATSNKKSARSSTGESSSRKRNKKKANVVYTDEEDEEYFKQVKLWLKAKRYIYPGDNAVRWHIILRCHDLHNSETR